MSRSFELTSGSFQKYSWRPCTHSKYETTTPPALARMSGRTRMPLSSRISSAVGVVRGDHLLQRARREHVALQEQQLLVGDLLGALEAGERARLLLVGDRGGDVDPVRVVQPDPRVRDRDHGRALLREELREEAAAVAEPLHRDPPPREL